MPTDHIKKLNIHGRPYYVIRLKDVDELILNIEEWATRSGFETDTKAKVSTTDDTAGFLATKIVAGAGVTLAVLNSPGNETLEISAGGGGASGIYGGDGDVLANTTINDRTASWGGTTAGTHSLTYNARGSGQIRVAGWANNGTTAASLTGAFSVAAGGNAKLLMGIFNNNGTIEFGYTSGGLWGLIRESGTYLNSSMAIGQVGVATDARLQVKGADALASNKALCIENSIATDLMTIQNDGVVGINQTSPDASAQLDLYSTTRGFLPPRMTTTEMDAIVSPAFGLIIYDVTTNQWMGYRDHVTTPAWVVIG